MPSIEAVKGSYLYLDLPEESDEPCKFEAQCAIIIDWEQRQLLPLALFELTNEADFQQLKKAYKFYTKSFHPDLNQNSELCVQAFSILTSAYNYLCFDMGSRVPSQYRKSEVEIQNNMFYRYLSIDTYIQKLQAIFTAQKISISDENYFVTMLSKNNALLSHLSLIIEDDKLNIIHVGLRSGMRVATLEKILAIPDSENALLEGRWDNETDTVQPNVLGDLLELSEERCPQKQAYIECLARKFQCSPLLMASLSKVWGNLSVSLHAKNLSQYRILLDDFKIKPTVEQVTLVLQKYIFNSTQPIPLDASADVSAMEKFVELIHNKANAADRSSIEWNQLFYYALSRRAHQVILFMHDKKYVTPQSLKAYDAANQNGYVSSQNFYKWSGCSTESVTRTRMMLPDAALHQLLLKAGYAPYVYKYAYVLKTPESIPYILQTYHEVTIELILQWFTEVVQDIRGEILKNTAVFQHFFARMEVLGVLRSRYPQQMNAWLQKYMQPWLAEQNISTYSDVVLRDLCTRTQSLGLRLSEEQYEFIKNRYTEYAREIFNDHHSFLGGNILQSPVSEKLYLLTTLYICLAAHKGLHDLALPAGKFNISNNGQIFHVMNPSFFMALILLNNGSLDEQIYQIIQIGVEWKQLIKVNIRFDDEDTVQLNTSMNAFDLALYLNKADLGKKMVLQQIQKYIYNREQEPDFIRRISLFGRTMHFGYSKAQKINAAKALMNFLEHETPIPLAYKGALSNGRLQSISKYTHKVRGLVFDDNRPLLTDAYLY